MSSKNTSKLNVPQARAAMDKFKMEAASEVDVPSTYCEKTTDEQRPTTYTGNIQAKRQDVGDLSLGVLPRFVRPAQGSAVPRLPKLPLFTP